MKKLFAILAMLLATVCIFTSCSVELTVKDGCLVVNGVETGIKVDTEDTGIPQHTHAPAGFVIENEIEATCDKDGSYDLVMYCSYPGCNFEINRVNTVIESEGHSFENGICTSCGAEDPDYNPVCAEHKWSEEVVIITPHSIDNVGTELKTCVDCGFEYEVQIGHTLVAGESVSPTCTEDGYTTYNCACGYSNIEELASLGHTPAVEFDPSNPDTSVWRECPNLDEETCPCLYEPVYITTCTFDGCNELITAIGVAMGHIWGDWEEVEYEDGLDICPCEREFVFIRLCAVCGTVDDEMKSLPAYGHVFTVWEPVIDITGYLSPCESVPLEASLCDICGHEYCIMTRPVPGATAMGHHWGDWYIITAPTYESEGVIARECSVCSSTHATTEICTIPPLNCTDYSYTGIFEGCEDFGQGFYTIVVDYTEITINIVLEPIGHDFSNGIYVIDTIPGYATSEEDALSKMGVVVFFCDICGESIYKEIPALGGAATGRYIVSMGDCLDPVDVYCMPIDADGYQVFVEFEVINPSYVHDEIPPESEWIRVNGGDCYYWMYKCEKCDRFICIDIAE